MENKKVTILVGAGAVENAWKPVIEAINSVTDRNITNGDAANCFFAQLVYLARFYASINHPDCPQILKVTIDNINIVKKSITKNLKQFQEAGIIKVRPEFQAIISKFIISKQNRGAIISTNWDTVVDNEINKLCHLLIDKPIPVLHLHGDINSNIYLPSEVTFEKYRTRTEENEFGQKHIQCNTLLENTDELIIYGLSLSPLDAELLQTLHNLYKTKDIYH